MVGWVEYIMLAGVRVDGIQVILRYSPGRLRWVKLAGMVDAEEGVRRHAAPAAAGRSHAAGAVRLVTQPIRAQLLG
jgi:hypothetical protein